MADENNIGANSTPAAEPQNTAHEHMIPKARFDEVNNKYKDLAAQLDAFKVQQQQAEEKRMAEQQQFKELAEKYKSELDALKPQASLVDEWRESVQATVQAMIERLPEDVRDLVPSYDDPRQTLDWLNKNSAKLMRPTAPQMDAGARGDTRNTNAELTPEEMQMARMMGMDVSDYAAFKVRHAKQKQQAQTANWMQNLGHRIQGE